MRWNDRSGSYKPPIYSLGFHYAKTRFACPEKFSQSHLSIPENTEYISPRALDMKETLSCLEELSHQESMQSDESKEEKGT